MRADIEKATDVISVHFEILRAVDLLNIDNNWIRVMIDKGIIKNPDGKFMFIPALNEWISNRKPKKESEPIQNHVLLIGINPDMYKEHENLYKSLVVAKMIQDKLIETFPNHASVRGAKAMAWVKEVDLMINEDGRTYHEIWDTFKLSQTFKKKHEEVPFWKSVIQSPAGLRKHYDKIAVNKQVQEESNKVKRPQYMADEER
jgi:hypothetical protein